MKKIIIFWLAIFILTSFSFTEDKGLRSEELRLIVVKGSDYVEALPDTAYFNINISVEKDSPEEAASLGEQLKKNIRNVLNKNNILKEDVLEESADIYPRYDYQNKQNIHAFVYRAKLRIADFNKLALLRKEIFNPETFAPVKESWFTKRGLTAESNVDYEIVKNKGDLAQKALKKAYDIALLKVKGIAETSALKYRIHTVVESGTMEIAPPQLYRRKSFGIQAMAEDASKEAVLTDETIPSLQRINAEVTVEAEII